MAVPYQTIVLRLYILTRLCSDSAYVLSVRRTLCRLLYGIEHILTRPTDSVVVTPPVPLKEVTCTLVDCKPRGNLIVAVVDLVR